MSVFEHPEFDDHLQVCFFRDEKAGLRAITAIHALSPLGTSGGGCRIYPYASDDDALRDALRLSKAMTYKLALAGLPAGGAKTVVIADPGHKNEALLRALGRAVDRLGGKYVIAEDVGSTPDDMEVIAKETRYVAGRKMWGRSGDTSPATGYGAYLALKSAVQRKLGREDVRNLRVAVQGVGHVGYQMCKFLAADGAKLWVSDIDKSAVDRAVREFAATAVDADKIYDVDADAFAPCALGAILNDDTIPRLRCSIVAGAANNQLAEDRHAEALAARDILYAPDFVANMGGVIAASMPGVAEPKVLKRCERISQTMQQVFERAEKEQFSTHVAAVSLARAAFSKSAATPRLRYAVGLATDLLQARWGH